MTDFCVFVQIWLLIAVYVQKWTHQFAPLFQPNRSSKTKLSCLTQHTFAHPRSNSSCLHPSITFEIPNLDAHTQVNKLTCCMFVCYALLYQPFKQRRINFSKSHVHTFNPLICCNSNNAGKCMIGVRVDTNWDFFNYVNHRQQKWCPANMKSQILQRTF